MTAKEYNKCVDMYADNIYRFVLKHLKNKDVSHDVVQETFAKVWVKKENIANGTPQHDQTGNTGCIA